MKLVLLIPIYMSLSFGEGTQFKGKILIIDKYKGLPPAAADIKNTEFEHAIEQESLFPPTTDRDQVFDSVHLPKNWDELDKDVFYMDLKTKSVHSLIKKYPMFQAKALERMKERIVP